MMKKLVLMMTLSALLSSCGSDQMPQVVLPEIDTSNPLLAEWDTPYATPPFDKIKISDYDKFQLTQCSACFSSVRP